MRITFIASGLGTGGAEFALLRLCRAFMRQGVRPSVASLLDEGEIGPLMRNDGVPVLTLGLRAPLAWLAMRRAFDTFRSQCRPQLLQGWMYHGNLAALHLAPTGTPVAWSVRQSLAGNRDKAATRLVIRAGAALSARPACIVYNSANAKVQHEAVGFASARALMIPNGLDLEEFRFDGAARARIRTELGLGPEHIVIGHVARFHPSKDHAGLLRAVARIARAHPTLRAVLAGDCIDSRNATLTSLATELGIADRVSLLGRRPDVSALMSAFDLFCSSSSSMEGFPNVVAEAMSCEVPCVATDVGDSLAVVGSGGRVVPPADEAALAAALDSMIRMTDEGRRSMGNSARQHIADHYTIDAVATQYLRLYASIVAFGESKACAA